MSKYLWSWKEADKTICLQIFLPLCFSDKEFPIGKRQKPKGRPRKERFEMEISRILNLLEFTLFDFKSYLRLEITLIIRMTISIPGSPFILDNTIFFTYANLCSNFTSLRKK